MFAKLWKQSTESNPSQTFQFAIERQRGEPLRFNGHLEFESIGRELPGYRSGEPWHHLRVYRMESTEFAVVIEFHIDESTIIVDAGTVTAAADVDDFFCLHAGDHFHRLTLVDDDLNTRDKELEQRVLSCYDRQLLEVLNHLSKSDFGVKNG
jgi:hypothetical protein